MRTVYPSKVSFSLVLFVLGITAVLFVPACFDIGDMAYYLFTALLFLVEILMLFGIRYTIDGTTLEIQSAVVFREHYDIMKITSIKGTHTFLSAPACSFDRIAICCDGKKVIISPRRKEEFVRQLCALNPAIQVQLG